jgi:hypothetical protein
MPKETDAGLDVTQNEPSKGTILYALFIDGSVPKEIADAAIKDLNDRFGCLPQTRQSPG